MRNIRISAISYLNTAPLMWDFENGKAGRDFDISYTVPSQCADELRQGRADIGIIPAAAYATIPDLVILPGVAIASKQPVRSILLVSKVPLEKIRTVALDTSSLTSVALTKLLFERWWGGGRTFVNEQPHLDRMLGTNDAGLLIGDPALRVERSRYYTYDLAEEWIRLTGKSFVFAFWAMRADSVRHAPAAVDIAGVFQESRDHGLEPQSVNAMARDWAPRLGLTEKDVRDYLTQNIHYSLDSACVEGLQLFYRYAADYKLLPPVAELQFLNVAQPQTR